MVAWDIASSLSGVLVLVAGALLPDLLLGLEEPVGVTLLRWLRPLRGQARGGRPGGLRGCGRVGGWGAEERLAGGGHDRVGRRFEPGRGAGAVELLADLGLAALELLHVLGGDGDLAAPELLPLRG